MEEAARSCVRPLAAYLIPSPVPGAHMVEGENTRLQVVLRLLHTKWHAPPVNKCQTIEENIYGIKCGKELLDHKQHA